MLLMIEIKCIFLFIILARYASYMSRFVCPIRIVSHHYHRFHANFISSSLSPTTSYSTNPHPQRTLTSYILSHNDESQGDDEEEIVDVEVDYDMLQRNWIDSGHDASSFTIERALLALEYDDDTDNADDMMNRRSINHLSSHFISPSGSSSSKQHQPQATKKRNRLSLLQRRKQRTSLPLASSSASSKPHRSVGIDLGTTNSAISIIEKGIPTIISIDGMRIIPSVVTYTNHPSSPPMISSSSSTIPYDNDIMPIVGSSAKQQLLINPKNTFSSVKRLMGEGVDAVGSSTRHQQHIIPDPMTGMKLRRHYDRRAQLNMNMITKRLIDHHHDDANDGNDGASMMTSRSQGRLICPALQRDLSPEEVSAQILRKLLAGASNYTGHNITRAVITVPAYFSQQQCQATIVAGKMAGLEKIKLLREPEAAALAYGFTRQQPQLVLVFDLGGGTFDVSILEVGGGFVEVIATSGDSHLGGDDFDAMIAQWIIDQLATTITSIAPSPSSPSTSLAISSSKSHIMQLIIKNPILVTNIYHHAEIAKMELSSHPNTTIQINVEHHHNILYDDHVIDGNYSFLLTRSKFESLTKNLLQLILRPVREAALMAGINLPGESGQLGINEYMKQNDVDNVEDVDDEQAAVASLKKMQVEGKQKAKQRQKTRGQSMQQLRHMQKDRGDSTIAMFPGGQMLDEVILVGGATRMPAVRRMVRAITGIDNVRSFVNVDEAVSLGAAVMAGILDGDITDMQVMSSWQAAIYRAFAEDSILRDMKTNEIKDMKLKHIMM